MEDNDGFIPLKKNENGVFTPVEDDGFIPVTKTSDGIFVSAEGKKKSVANQSDTQSGLQTPSEQPMQPSIESGQEDKGILNKIGDAFSGAWNKVLSGQGLFGTERETLAQQKQLEQRQNAIDLAIAKRNETERLKNEAVQKSDLVRENLRQYKAESDAVEYAAQFPEYKQLQQIDAAISAMGKPSNPQQQVQYNALLAEREKLLDTDVSKRDVFAESGPKLEIKNPSDFATASEYADYQNKLFNQFNRFSKEKEKFDTAKPKFEAATKLRDVLDVAQKSQTQASWIADKVKSIQKESDDYINAARELNKDRLEPLGFTKAFVDGIQQTSLANSIADIYALGNDDKLLKSLENIYIDNAVFPKETTALGSVGELIGGQVEPLAIGVGGGAINPIAGVVGATAEYARLGAGGQLIDAYTTARQQGMTASEALEVAKKTAIAGGVGGAAEGLAGAVTFGGKPAKELVTMGYKQAVKEALKDNSIDAVIAGINQTVQNKNMQRLGLDVETDRGVIENMSAELLFGAGMNLAMYGGSKVKGYGTLINGIAKMPLADIQLQVDNAVKQGVLNEANAQRFVSDVSKSKEAQDKLQGIDIPEANQDKAIDLQKEIDDLEAKKKTASPAILPAIENKVEALTGELQIVAGVPLTMQERAELNRLQTARDTNTEYDKDRLGVLEARQKAASEKEVIAEPKIEQNAEEQQSGTLRGESEQVQTEGQRDSDMPIVNEAKLQDGQVIEEVAPPVVEQTTADVGGVMPPNVSEALKDVESTAKALENVDATFSADLSDSKLSVDERKQSARQKIKDNEITNDASYSLISKALEKVEGLSVNNIFDLAKRIAKLDNKPILIEHIAEAIQYEVGRVSGEKDAFSLSIEDAKDVLLNWSKDAEPANKTRMDEIGIVGKSYRDRINKLKTAKKQYEQLSQQGKALIKSFLNRYNNTILEDAKLNTDEYLQILLNITESSEVVDFAENIQNAVRQIEDKEAIELQKLPSVKEPLKNEENTEEALKRFSSQQLSQIPFYNRESIVKMIDEQIKKSKQVALNVLPIIYDLPSKVSRLRLNGNGEVELLDSNDKKVSGKKITKEQFIDIALQEGNSQRKNAYSISEAYHKAKADGSNPELVKAVEEALSKPNTNETTPTKAGVSSNSNEGNSALRAVESTAKALESVVPKNESFAFAISTLPIEGTINYKDIKQNDFALPFERYVNSPEKIDKEIRSAYRIYEFLKEGGKLPNNVILLDKEGKILDGNNRVKAQLALGITDFKYAVANNTIFTQTNYKTISEAYHKAKADGSNPELVKAVEELLRRPTETKSQVSLQSEGQSKLTSEIPLSEQKTGNKGFENTLNEQKGAGQGKAGLQESDGGAERKSQPRQKSATTESTQITPETKAKFEQAQRLYEEIANAEGGTKKRQLASERKKFLDENPTIKFIDDNIKSITSQLEKAGRLIKKGDCP